MPPLSHQEYSKLITDIIQKQMVVFGPTATFIKTRSVNGLSVSDNGSVSGLTGDPQEITRLLLEHLMELSEFSVRKTVEPILSTYDGVSFTELGIPNKQQSTPVTTKSPPSNSPQTEPPPKQI